MLVISCAGGGGWDNNYWLIRDNFEGNVFAYVPVGYDVIIIIEL